MHLADAAREWSVYTGLIARIFPIVQEELRTWTDLARRIPDPDLRRQALTSIDKKKFHCMGGAVFGLLNPSRAREIVRSVVAIQTISDYLDNLCDRMPEAVSPEGQRGPAESEELCRQVCIETTVRDRFMQLHEAMLCAVDLERPVDDYYSLYPLKDSRGDGGYLDSLVEASRSLLAGFQGYSAVRGTLLDLATLYCEMQSLKHLSPTVRDGLMQEWFLARGGGLSSSLTWWEFGAAAGSTLGIFALIAYSSRNPPGWNSSTCEAADSRAFSQVIPARAERLAWIPAVRNAYFPAISALHILLDYYIDQEEDEKTGDLNFVSYYSSASERLHALCRFLDMSLGEVQLHLSEPWFHRAVVKGLLAMYLSDPKVEEQGLSGEAKRLTARAGFPAESLRKSCGVVRRMLRF